MHARLAAGEMPDADVLNRIVECGEPSFASFPEAEDEAEDGDMLIEEPLNGCGCGMLILLASAIAVSLMMWGGFYLF